MEKKIYTPAEYSKELKIEGKEVSPKTVIRKCEANLLPSNVEAKKVGRVWILFVGF
jgi:hypothetical protein